LTQKKPQAKLNDFKSIKRNYLEKFNIIVSTSEKHPKTKFLKALKIWVENLSLFLFLRCEYK
jgi:hypothetical protein